MSEINYDDKVDLVVDTGIDDIFKVTASDMNEIKNVVNGNADEVGDISTLTTTDKTSVVNAVNELNTNKLETSAIVNEASTETDEVYSSDYLNDKLVSVGTTAPTDGRRVWFKKSKNLFNKDSITTGKYITDTGGEGTNSTAFCGGFIKVQPSTKYYVSGRNNGWGNVAFYDSNKTFISRVNEVNNIFTTTSTTYYIRANGSLSDLNTLQIEQGVQPTSYEPYIEPSINVDEEELHFDNYSTSEQVIGKWLNGKTLYRKCYSAGALKNNGQNLIKLNITNFDKLVKMYGVSYSSGYTMILPFIHQNSSSIVNMFFENGTKTIGIETHSDRTTYTKTYVVVEYTKTTD